MTGEGGAASVIDWAAPVEMPAKTYKPLAIVGAPLLLLIAAVAVLAGPLVGVAVLLVAALGLGALLLSVGGRLLQDLGAQPAQAGSRAINLATGLAADVGLPSVRIWIVPGEGANALAVWHRGPNIGVTSSLLATFTRTETEAAIAHCLVRLRDERRIPTFATALRSLGISSSDAVMRYTDVKAAAVTRYPPALASALEKSVPRRGKDSLLWMVADDVGQEPVTARAEALRDL